MDKTELRRSLLHQRQALSREQWQVASQQICQLLQSAELFQQARTILVYLSHRQEPELGYLWRTYPETYPETYPKKKWGLPRCQGKDLIWHHWQPNSTRAIVKNSYGIGEPAANLPMISVEEVDLILVPCVGCDRSGHRLGYGGGYYDRLLSQPPWQNKPTLGIIFSFAYLEKLPVEPWDVPLQGVCTEQEIVYF